MINLNFTVKNATQPLCAVCALSVRCLCVVCALSVRCLCAVCAPSVLRGADLKFAKRARAPALRHDAPRTYRGADSFPDFVLHPYRSVGPNTPNFPTFFPPMRYIAQRYTGQSSRVPLFQKMGKLCATLPPPLLSDGKAPPVFNFPVGPEIHFSVPTVLDNERARFSCSRSQTLAHSRSTPGMYPLTPHSMIN